MDAKTFKKVIIWTVILAVIAIIGITGFKHFKEYYEANKTVDEELGSSTNITEKIEEDNSVGVDTSLKDGGLTLSSMENEYNSFVGKMGIYTRVWCSDTEFFIEIFNTNKEAIVQYQDEANTTIVFNANGVAVQYGVNDNGEDYVLASGNKDVINQVGLAIEAAKKGIGKFQALDISKDYDETTYEFAVDFNGWNEISEFYNLIDPETAEMLVDVYRSQFDYMGFLNDGPDTEMSLRFVIVCNETSGLVEGGIEYYSGIETKGLEQNPEVFIYELFNDYYLIPDWALDEVWYRVDYSSLVSSTETVSQCHDMLSGLIGDLKVIMDNYFNENYTLDSDLAVENGEVVEHHEDLDNTDNSGDFDGEGTGSDQE